MSSCREKIRIRPFLLPLRAVFPQAITTTQHVGGAMLRVARTGAPKSIQERQVTDAYLIELAKRHKGKVATLDAGLADLLPQAERARYVSFIGAA